LLEATRRALPWLPDGSFLGEPAAKNTAPCIAWATAIARRRDPDALVMVLPSDHHIGDEPGFRQAVLRALEAARTGAIVTIGIAPTRPETGYGYVEAAEEVAAGVRRVARFVEKPSRERAEQYLAGGRHYWNAGMFFFQAGSMLQAFATHAPEIAEGVLRIEAAAARGTDQERAETARVFADVPSISIDYAVMEKAEPLWVVPASFGWNDLGSWESAWELGEKDPENNVAAGDCVLIDARGNLVRDLSSSASKKLVALVGVNDLCVIETDDALLVIPRERSQDVRHVIEALKQRGRTDLS
jgi:mannose-1-phosphate guanylyltransferase